MEIAVATPVILITTTTEAAKHVETADLAELVVNFRDRDAISSMPVPTLVTGLPEMEKTAMELKRQSRRRLLASRRLTSA